MVGLGAETVSGAVIATLSELAMKLLGPPLLLALTWQLTALPTSASVTVYVSTVGVGAETSVPPA
jgi:hypothetical protein